MKLEEKLFTLRKEKGLSQMELAELMDVSRQAISRWEVGTSVPSTDNLRYLGKLYGVTLDYLLDDDAPKPETVTKEQGSPEAKQQNTAAAGTGTNRLVLILVAIMTAVAVLLCAVLLRDEQQKPVPMNEIEGSEVEEDSTIDFDLDF